jgi:hypothetical protein
MGGEGAIQICWTHGRWMSETGVANLHQVRMPSLREMGQLHACCSGYLPSPFPHDQNRLTEADPEIQI